jgi:integrase
MSKMRRQDSIGCSIGRRPDGTLRLRFRWQGRARSVATGLEATAENVRALLPLARLVGATIEADEDPTDVLKRALIKTLGHDSGPAFLPPAGPTVSEYFEQWITEQTPMVRKAQARDYRRHLRQHVLPALGGRLLAELRAADVRGLQAELLSAGLSTKYVKNIISGTFRAMIQQAKIDDEVTRDLFAGLKWPQWKPPDPDPFAADERNRILDWFLRKRFGFHAGRPSAASRLLPHAAYHGYLHALFWTGLRPSEASGLQWRDVDLKRGRLHVARSRHLYEYGAPKTRSADRWVELFPESIRLLELLQPLRVAPEVPVFINTLGKPIEPKAFSRHWYDCLRALGIRQRGLYCTKDTFVTTALATGVRIAWLEQQTGVAYATLRRHYGRWMPDEMESELRRFAEVDPELFNRENVSVSKASTDTSSVSSRKDDGSEMRGGGFEPPRVLPH